MTQPIHDRLLELREEIRILEGRKSVLEEARNTVRHLEHLHDSLTEKLAKEQTDVDKLQGLSLTGLFASVLGNKVEKFCAAFGEFGFVTEVFQWRARKNITSA